VKEPIAIAGETYTGHIFLNEHKQADAREAFLRKLLDAETLAVNQGFTQKVRMEDFLQDQLADLVPYFNIRKQGSRYGLARDSAAIDRHIGRLGIFVLITNTDLSGETVISYYREKDGVEKCFDSLKNNLSFRRLRVHSNQNMEGLLFVEFIAMILRSKMNVVLRDPKLHDMMCIPEMLAEMRKLKEITFGRKKALSEVSREQKLILSAFGVTLEHRT